MKRKIKAKQIKTKVSGVKVKALLEKAYIVIRPGGAVEILVRHKKLHEDMFVRPGSDGSMINLVKLTGEGWLQRIEIARKTWIFHCPLFSGSAMG